MCTAAGRKAAQQAGTVGRRAPGRMVSKSKFVGGYSALSKRGAVGMTSTTQQYDQGGDNEGSMSSRTTYSAKGPYVGQSGQRYQSRVVTETGYDDSEAGMGEYVSDRYTVSGYSGRKPRLGVKGPHNVGAVSAKQGKRGGAIFLKSEEHARSVYKDFGKDFDKDAYRGDFYKTTRGLANQQRQNTQGQESALRKVHRIRQGGGPNTAAGNVRRKQKKQGNLRISSGGIQGGSTGGGTTLS